MPSHYFQDFRFPDIATRDANVPEKSASLPSLQIDTSTQNREAERGSAHVSIELQDEELQHASSVTIQADCTSPPWTDQEMLYCGLTSTSKHLFTMLYEDIPTKPVQFRMRAGNRAVVEPTFYKQVIGADGTVNNVVEPWAVQDSGMLTPTESERAPRLRHELTEEMSPRSSVFVDSLGVGNLLSKAAEHEPWRRHRRQPSTAFTLPSTPHTVTGGGRLPSIAEIAEDTRTAQKPTDQTRRRIDSSIEPLSL